MAQVTCLGKHVNLQLPTDVERFIYSMNCKNVYKNKLFEAYERFCRANDVCYVRPKKLKSEQFAINVPTEDRIDSIVAYCEWVYTTVFNLRKHVLGMMRLLSSR
jgi:hypothetical protein